MTECPVSLSGKASLREASLAQALAFCRDLTRRHSKTFFLGASFFAPRERAAVWAVYAACRQGDDMVDEVPPHEAAPRLAEWWSGIEAAYAGHPGADPVRRALAWAVREYPVPLSAFHELHEGLRMDLEGFSYRDMEDLTLYCRRVAGVVGFMVAPVAGYRGGETTLQRALMLGQAMQLTNILRDVGEDLERGRLYLPQSLLGSYGVTREELEAGRSGGAITPQYRALLQHLIALAREWYAQGRQGIPHLEGRAQLAVLTAAYAYEAILGDLERHGYDNLRRRAFVGRRHKALLLGRAWWALRRRALP